MTPFADAEYPSDDVVSDEVVSDGPTETSISERDPLALESDRSTGGQDSPDAEFEPQLHENSNAAAETPEEAPPVSPEAQVAETESDEARMASAASQGSAPE